MVGRSGRRGFVALGTGALPAAAPAEQEQEVSPNEDLMREHGVLVRCLLIYHIDARQDFPPDVVSGTAKLIRSFVEDYHEKLEENHLFPRFVDLVNVLQTQHRKGRIATERVLQASTPSALKDEPRAGLTRRARTRCCFPPSQNRLAARIRRGRRGIRDKQAVRR